MSGAGIVLCVKVTPRASADKVAGVETGADGAAVLAVRVRALPEAGKANRAVLALLSDWLAIPKSVMTVALGAGSRLKRISIEGNPEDIMMRLRQRLRSLEQGG